jgi:hypothetical protein
MSLIDFDPIGDITGQTQQQGQGAATVVDLSQNYDQPLMSLMGQEYLLRRRQQMADEKAQKLKAAQLHADFFKAPLINAIPGRLKAAQDWATKRVNEFMSQYGSSPVMYSYLQKRSTNDFNFDPQELQFQQDLYKFRADLSENVKNEKAMLDQYKKNYESQSKKPGEIGFGAEYAEYVSGKNMEKYGVGTPFTGHQLEAKLDFEKELKHLKDTIHPNAFKGISQDPTGAYLVTETTEGFSPTDLKVKTRQWAQNIQQRAYDGKLYDTNLALQAKDKMAKHNDAISAALEQVPEANGDWRDPRVQKILQSQGLLTDMQEEKTKQGTRLTPIVTPYNDVTSYMGDEAFNRVWYEKTGKDMKANPYALENVKHLNRMAQIGEGHRLKEMATNPSQMLIEDKDQNLILASFDGAGFRKEQKPKRYDSNESSYVLTPDGLRAYDKKTDGDTFQGLPSGGQQLPVDKNGKILSPVEIKNGAKPAALQWFETSIKLNDPHIQKLIEKSKAANYAIKNEKVSDNLTKTYIVFKDEEGKEKSKVELKPADITQTVFTPIRNNQAGYETVKNLTGKMQAPIDRSAGLIQNYTGQMDERLKERSVPSHAPYEYGAEKDTEIIQNKKPVNQNTQTTKKSLVDKY